VDVLLERLADADRLGTGGHLEVYEDVHRELRDTLASLDGRPAPAPHPTATPDGRPAGRGSPPLTPTPYDDDRS
jgi:hypothetical protein